MAAVKLSPAFGSLAITSEPSGAEVYLAGEKVGLTPYSNEKLASAQYLLSLRAPLYQSLENQGITVSDGKKTREHYTLQANFGTLAIAAGTAGATVTVSTKQNNVVINKTVPVQLKLEPGQYQVAVSKSGYATNQFTVTLTRGGIQRLSREETHLRQLMGTLIVSSEPFVSGAKVYVDGQLQGEVPATLQLPVGEHVLELKHTGRGAMQTVVVKDQQSEALALVLKQTKSPYEPEMLEIPGGSFRMGDLNGGGRRNEKPVHTVNIKRFALAKTEATFAQWDACVRAGGCKYKPKDKGWLRGNRPVINVSWEDAMAYAQWLSKETGKRYRLPSEAEWEYAARAGSTTKFSWGNDVGKNKANCSGCGSQWDDETTAPVSSFQANAFGLYDMQGNVWEWVQDCYHDSYQGAPNDGSAWTTGKCKRRVLRGGSWGHDPWLLRSAYRYGLTASSRFSIRGFRLAQDL